MKRFLFSLLLLLIAPVVLHGQQGNTVTIQFAGAPTGTCSNIMVAINTSNGDYYNCLSGVWNKIATGGGATISGTIAANQVAKGTAANVIGASSITDDATTVLTPEVIMQGTTSDCIKLGATATGTQDCGDMVHSSGATYIHAFNANTGYEPLHLAASSLSFDVPAGSNSVTVGSGLVQGGADVNTVGTGGPITVRGQNVVAGGANNLAGGAVVIQGGIGTGTATPAPVKIQSTALGLASANTQQSLVTRYVTHVKAGSTTSATPTTLFNIASATNSTWGVKILIHVQLISSTPNVCGTTQEFSLTGTNNNGAFGTVSINAGTTAAGTLSTLCSAGTLTLAVSATAANPSVISVTPTWGTITSITSATITVEIWNPSQQEIALL